MAEPRTDYALRGLQIAALVTVVLLVVSFIPPVTVGGMQLRRANIFADLYAFEERAAANRSSVELFDERDFAVDFDAVTRQIDAAPLPPDPAEPAPDAPRPAADTLRPEAAVSFEWRLAAPAAERPAPRPDPQRYAPRLTPIEDFSADGRFAAFCDTLLSADRPVRIAVLGDSFVEGDILTADLRERLQSAFGGRGTGFAPMASPLTAYRRTVRTQSKGWTAYNVMKHKSVPAPLGEHFYVSGWVCRPTDGASTRWEATQYRRRLDSCTTARVLFIAPARSRIELVLNDTLHHRFTVEGAPHVRQTVVTAPSIHTLEFRVLEGASAMIGYGAVFEQKGVSVDNYSVRSNNGQAIFRTNPAVNAQINALAGYDLVILQYGLNIMQAGVRSYTNYGAQIEKIIAYVRHCFPTAAVLVMGVSDRAVRSDQGVASMDAIPYMLDCQRTAARNQGAAFWSTYDAMQADGGISEFVARGWAGKDFTHINYAGGRRVAWALFDAINAEAKRAAERLQRRTEPVVDSAVRASIDRIGLRPTLRPEEPAPSGEQAANRGGQTAGDSDHRTAAGAGRQADGRTGRLTTANTGRQTADRPDGRQPAEAPASSSASAAALSGKTAGNSAGNASADAEQVSGKAEGRSAGEAAGRAVRRARRAAKQAEHPSGRSAERAAERSATETAETTATAAPRKAAAPRSTGSETAAPAEATAGTSPATGSKRPSYAGSEALAAAAAVLMAPPVRP